MIKNYFLFTFLVALALPLSGSEKKEAKKPSSPEIKLNCSSEALRRTQQEIKKNTAVAVCTRIVLDSPCGNRSNWNTYYLPVDYSDPYYSEFPH